MNAQIFLFFPYMKSVTQAFEIIKIRTKHTFKITEILVQKLVLLYLSIGQFRSTFPVRRSTYRQQLQIFIMIKAVFFILCFVIVNSLYEGWFIFNSSYFKIT